MKREHVYCAIIVGGLLLMIAIGVYNFWPARSEPLASPAVIAQRLTSGTSKEEQVQAARDFIRHGEAARVEIRQALVQHQTFDSTVVVPLLQATGKARDYRSMPTLLELLESPEPTVRGQAAVAIEKILGAEFGYDPYASPEAQAKVIAVIKQDYQNAGPRLQEFYREQ